MTYLNLIEVENTSQIIKLASMQNGYQEKWNKLREKVSIGKIRLRTCR